MLFKKTLIGKFDCYSGLNFRDDKIPGSCREYLWLLGFKDGSRTATYLPIGFRSASLNQVLLSSTLMMDWMC
jgi:hypothetical protein